MKPRYWSEAWKAGSRATLVKLGALPPWYGAEASGANLIAHGLPVSDEGPGFLQRLLGAPDERIPTKSVETLRQELPKIPGVTILPEDDDDDNEHMLSWSTPGLQLDPKLEKQITEALRQGGAVF